jgi:hypothetical protein
MVAPLESANPIESVRPEDEMSAGNGESGVAQRGEIGWLQRPFELFGYSHL